MEITCQSCQSHFTIADDRIPAGRVVHFKCPKCREKISAQRPDAPNPKPAAQKPKSMPTSQADAPKADAAATGSVLTCIFDVGMRKQVAAMLAHQGYGCTPAATVQEALRQLRHSEFDVIIVSSDFEPNGGDANGVLIYLERLEMVQRRKMIVVELGSTLKTRDHMTAFCHSVDLIINHADIAELEALLNRCIAEKRSFYRGYNKALESAGRA